MHNTLHKAANLLYICSSILYYAFNTHKTNAA